MRSLLITAALVVSVSLWAADPAPTVSSVFWTSAISGQQAPSIPWTDSRFVLSGGSSCGAASDSGPLQAYAWCAAPEPDNAPTWHVDFNTDAQDFEIVNLVANLAPSTGSYWRVSVNGVWLQNQYVTDLQVNSGTFIPQFTRLQFPVRGRRAIHIEANSKYLFGGVVMQPGDSITAPQLPKRLKAVFFGDSYLIPAGPAVSVGFFSYVGDYFNWDWTTLPLGGTGYVNPGNTGNVTFGQRVQQIVSLHPDVVVVVGGINDNDYSPDSLQQAVSNFYAALRQGLPNAVIFAAGPQSRGTAENIANPARAAAIKNGSAPYNVHFIDILGEQWVTDETNKSQVISSDSTHLTPYGNQYYAQRLIQDMAPVFAGNPVVSADGVVNAASYASPVAPGMLASLFGANLASGTAAAANLPLPTSLAGVSVTVNNIAAPLIYVSPTQINFQVPFGISPETAQVVVSSNGVAAGSAQTPGAAAAPGIFSAGKIAYAVKQNGTAISSSNGARPGDYIEVFATGGGSVNAPVPTGAAPDPSTLAAVQNAASVTIGGVAANVQYFGLAPGFVGLYQLNVQVPSLPAGSYPVVITMNSVSSNGPLVIVSP